MDEVSEAADGGTLDSRWRSAEEDSDGGVDDDCCCVADWTGVC